MKEATDNLNRSVTHRNSQDFQICNTLTIYIILASFPTSSSLSEQWHKHLRSLRTQAGKTNC